MATTSGDHPLRVVILWHMHQPNYEEPGARRMVMPWVRLHATKDYLDMPLHAARYDNVNVTFNLVPSLLDQFDLYLNGGTDPHLELSRIDASLLTMEQRMQVLDSFFSANLRQMIEAHPRYFELHRKAGASAGQAIQPRLFTSEEMRDLQVWSNLAWVDPIFRDEEPIATLVRKQKYFTEEEKHRLLDWQIECIKRIASEYRRLQDDGRIEVSFTPYYHPILPLLCDTNAALEALPKLTLPKERFRHPEDARAQIIGAINKYEQVFQRPMRGMWPSEGSVSEDVVKLCREAGIEWLASDEEVLYHSLRKSDLPASADGLYEIWRHNDVHMLFRDHTLSDRIGFVYSGMPADRAVDDFITQLRNIRERLGKRVKNAVVPIILDGENAWEYYPADGTEFLERFYAALSKTEDIKAMTVSEAIAETKSKALPKLFAGSWINHNFRIWIGHQQDNAAWDLLTRARQALVEWEQEHASAEHKSTIEEAWKQIYIAEGSDWCWWYGDEHQGPHNPQFDSIFRRHLMAVYDLIGRDIPNELMNPIYQSGSGQQAIMPESLVTPVIDGRLTHFFEWGGAGFYDSLKAGGAMHRMERFVAGLWFAYDYDSLYIRLDFKDKNTIELLKTPQVRINLLKPRRTELVLPISADGSLKQERDAWQCCARENVEIALHRSFLWVDSFGACAFTVSLLDGSKVLETWPEYDPIELDVPRPHDELFWPS